MSKSASVEFGWESPRWDGITRAYQAKDLERLREKERLSEKTLLLGTTGVEHSLARAGAEKLWRLLHEEQSIPALGAVDGNQAVEMAKAGLKAIYLSGRQVAADVSLSGQMYPDQRPYPINSVPNVVRSINNALMRADQIAHAGGHDSIDWMLPIVADAEAGAGDVLNAFERTKSMIEAGAAAIHFEDRVSSATKCGHMGGKMLAPAREVIHKLIAARLAADILDVPTVLIARTDANGAHLISSDCDPEDAPFLTSERTIEGFFATRGGIDAAIARGLAYAPYADILWCETSEPNLAEARKFANAIHAEFPGKLLAYNCSRSLRWKPRLKEWGISPLQRELAAMGYRFQFVAPSGFHALSVPAFEVAHEYAHSGLFVTATV